MVHDIVSTIVRNGLRRSILATVLFFAVGPLCASEDGHAAGERLDQARALAVSQAAIGHPVQGYRFVDSRGNTVALEQFRGRPIIVSLIYTSCSHTCPMLTNHLARMVSVAREAVGEDSFAVLTIGFDTAVDTPVRMASFARKRGIDLPGWFFLSADAPTIEALSRDLGFVFFRSPKGFDHLAQTTVLDANTRVYTQVYGQGFDAPLLVEPLKQLIFGTRAQASSLAGWINGVRLFCTIYDPSTGRYRFDYSLFVAITAGLISLGAVAVFLIRIWRQQRPPASSA